MIRLAVLTQNRGVTDSYLATAVRTVHNSVE